MANTNKVYTISIQMDAAQQQLADAQKKLEKLDASLEGLDRNSDGAKAIVAEMGKLAAEIDGLEGKVGKLGKGLDDLRPGSLGALKQQAIELEEALEAALVGSAESNKLIQQLGLVRAELKEIDERVDVAFSRDKAGALADTVSGLTGAISLATIAAQNFGLSSATAQEYQQKLTEIIAVCQSVESIHKLTTGEVRQALKNIVGDAKKVVLGYLGIGEAATASGTAASTSANVTRIALASLGITALLLILGLVITNWDKITAAVKRNKESILEAMKFAMPPLYAVLKVLDLIEKKFGSLSAFAAGVGAAFKQAFSNLGDVITGAEGQGISVAEAFHRGVLARNLELSRERAEALIKLAMESNARLLKEEQAAGKDVTARQRAQLVDELGTMERAANVKRSKREEITAEELKALKDKESELRAFDNAAAKKQADDENATELARMQGDITRRQARGAAVLAETLKQKEAELAQALNATQRNEAVITAKQAEVDAARLAIAKDAADKANALRLAQLNRQVAIEQAFGRDATSAILRVKEEELRQLLSAAQRNAAAILAKETEIMLVRVAKAKELGKLYGFSLEEIIKRQGEKEQKLHDELGAKIMAGTKQKTEQLAAEAAARAKIGIPVGLYDTILIKLFGVTPDQLDATKEIIAEAAASLSQSISIVSSTLLDAAYVNVQKRLDAAQLQYDEVSSKLDAATSARQSAEQQLASATGARRDFLLKKIESERSAEERLAKAKAMAAADEQRALKEKASLDKQQQRITAASTAAAAAYNAVLAIQAVLKATEKGASAGPPPFNILAIAAGVAAVGAAVVAARSFAKSFEDGGVTERNGLVSGPSHKQGGIQMWTRSGAHLGEMQGGEGILPIETMQHNMASFELLRTVGRMRPLIPEDFARAASFRVLPPAPRSFVDGGVTASGRGSTGDAGNGSARVDALEAKIDRTNMLLERLVGHAAITEAYSEITAAKPPMVPDYPTALRYEQLTKEAKQAAAPVTLGG